jgi:hypothetical protein
MQQSCSPHVTHSGVPAPIYWDLAMRPSYLGERKPTDPAAFLSDRRVRPWNDEFTASTVLQRAVAFLLFLCHLSLRIPLLLILNSYIQNR